MEVSLELGWETNMRGKTTFHAEPSQTVTQERTRRGCCARQARSGSITNPMRPAVKQRRIKCSRLALLMTGGLFVLVSASYGAINSSPHWAFQPVSRIQPPSVRQNSWNHHPIDQFILALLETSRLRPAAPATQEQLVRRVTFGLIGLLPTPEEVDAFLHFCSSRRQEDQSSKSKIGTPKSPWPTGANIAACCSTSMLLSMPIEAGDTRLPGTFLNITH